MISRETAFEYAKNEMQMGRMTAAQANVYAVQLMGAMTIHTKLPKDVRRALNDGVKSGELGHIKKEGLRPEAFHHKNGRARALEMIEREYRGALEKLKGVFA